ncbi:MAG: hypothetical protein IPH20_13575 [Bacteroidales bacterium]|nr:hypothetical protein [Bacteroidales bacterium]
MFDNLKDLPLVKPSKWYSVLFQNMHKAFKEFDDYIEFADWWDFTNLRPEDFEKDKLPNGKELWHWLSRLTLPMQNICFLNKLIMGM